MGKLRVALSVLSVAAVVLAAVTPLDAVPNAPASLSARVSGQTVSLTWSAPAGGASRYRVEAGTAPGLSNAANTIVGATTSLVVKAVPAGTYFVRVRALTAAGESGPSNEVRVSVGVSQAQACAALSAPANVRAAVNGSLVTLSWSPSTGCEAPSYVVNVGSAPGRSDLAIVNIGASSTLSAHAPAGTYYVQVVAISGEGRAASPTATVVVGQPSAPRPSAPGTSGRLRVVTWNIHHGKSKSGAYSLTAQAQLLAAQNPDVVALQEVQTWDEDQPARLEQLLEQLTGVPWTRQWAPVVDTARTEGNVVLTRLPVVSASSRQMHATGDWTALYSNRSAARLTVSIGGADVHLFSTHLDYYNTAHRTAQLQDLMAWTEQFGARRIVAGDFNSSPGQSWITTMLSEYADTWQEVTGAASGGATVNGVRFDYLFRSRDGGLTPTHVAVVPTALSDHALVVADYAVVR